MIYGEFRDGFPYATLAVFGLSGLVEIEFVIDAGFNGELALPEGTINQLGAAMMETRIIELASGFRRRCYTYELPVI